MYIQLAKTFCAISLLCAAAATTLPAQTLTTLHSFNNNNGQYPNGLIQGLDGLFFGITVSGGVHPCVGLSGCGTIFGLTATGTLFDLYNFAGPDGDGPKAIIQSTNGDLYGTTFTGGANGGGSIFKLDSSGTFTSLYSFCAQPACADGKAPFAGLIQAIDGNLYGTTEEGGASKKGTIFEITPAGTFTTLYSFCSRPTCNDGQNPYASLIEGRDGSLYGTTALGGSQNSGTIFKLDLTKKLTTLYSFCSLQSCTDGANSYTSLIQAPDGDFYGTTFYGGVATSNCTIGCGTVFKITPAGALKTLHSFCSHTNCGDGAGPSGALVRATDGNFYGTTQALGTGGAGTLFKLTPNSTLTVPYSFCSQQSCADGSNATFLAQSTDGLLYGTTLYGGATNNGTAFSLSVGLDRFVQPRVAAGKVGSFVQIMGNKLTAATRVAFNGTTAPFKIVSQSLIVAQVPIGATTGPLEVITPSATLSSNVPFRVLP